MKKILISFVIILLLTFTYTNTKAQAVAVVDDVAIASIIGISLLIIGGTGLLLKNNDNFVNNCNDIFEFLDTTTKVAIVAVASTKNYIDNTISVTKEQMTTIISGVYELVQSFSPPISVPAINFNIDSSALLSPTDVYRWSIACGDIPVTIHLTHQGGYDVFKIYVSNLKTITVSKPTFFYADKTVISSGITFDGYPHLTISSREYYNDTDYIDTQSLDLLQLIPIGNTIGDVTIPDVSISSDLNIDQWLNEADRSISLMLDTDTTLFELPIINSNLDHIFDDILLGDDLIISLPYGLEGVPTLTDYLPSELAKEFDPDVEEEIPIPLLPNLDWLKSLLNLIVELLNKILELITSFVSLLSGILEAINFDTSQFSLNLKPLQIPLFERFPYSLPWDLLKFLKLFYATPQIPDININIDTQYLKITRIIKVSPLAYMVGFFRYVITIWYTMFLVKKTRKFIKW